MFAKRVMLSFGLVVVVMVASSLVAVSTAPTDENGSYLSQARKLLSTGMETHNQASTFSKMMSKDETQTTRMLRDSISQATELINEYRQNGLSNMPNFPSLPGLSTLMRVPDKLLRAELSMLQDEIRMAQEMLKNPMTATMNAPRDLATMLSRMAEQLEQ